MKAADGLPLVQDLLSDPWPAMRAAALRAAAAIDPDSFRRSCCRAWTPIRSGRSARRSRPCSATLPAEVALGRVQAMLRDEDKRVLPAVLSAARSLQGAGRGTVALAQLKEPRLRRARRGGAGVGEMKPAGGADALRAAYALAQRRRDHATRGPRFSTRWLSMARAKRCPR